MAQRFKVLNAAVKASFVIDDHEPVIFEFDDFFCALEGIIGFRLDGYSSGLIKVEKNQKIQEILSQKLYAIEDSFPDVKASKFDKNNLINKKTTIRFFEELIKFLDIAYRNNSKVFVEGE